MKNLSMILPLALILCFMVGCQDKETEIERFMEDGVEVIVNHLEPYKLRREPSNLMLEKVLSIDTEMDDIVDLGLTDIGVFDVDSEGNIYMVNPKAREHFIFKFDGNGNFVNSFCRIGQGPGELSVYPYTLNVTYQNEITSMNQNNRKLLIFNSIGNLIDETLITIKGKLIQDVIPLKNGNYFCFYYIYDRSSDYIYKYTFALHDSDFKEINDLDEFKWANPFRGKKFKGININCYSITGDKIFVGSDTRGYEIWVFDLDGNLKRKIRKEYEKIPIPREFVEENMKFLSVAMRRMTDFPKFFPPFQFFFADSVGRLYVMTYEKGEDSGEYMFDIFNADGIFVGRKSIRAFYDYMMGTFLWAKGKQNHLYFRNEKDSGFKELVVYKMRWE
jgi:hypothetical protein